MTRQEVSIVSEIAGTTTDPVEKPMELLPLGSGALHRYGWHRRRGRARRQAGKEKLARCSTAPTWAFSWSTPAQWGEFEDDIFRELRGRNIPIVIAFNKSDIDRPLPTAQETLRKAKIPSVETVASQNRGVHELREALMQMTPEEFLQPPALVADLVPPGEMAVLVVPIDTEAPKGRLIVPQIQAIRDLLDGDAYCLVVKERELRDASGPIEPPAGAGRDRLAGISEGFGRYAARSADDLVLDSLCPAEGRLAPIRRRGAGIDRLRPGDRVLVAEACTHHPIGDDIGRVKIPRWLTQYVGGELQIDTTQGHDFPANLSDYRLVVHCGACMWNRREMLTRMAACRRAGVPICNYGMTIAFTLGIFDRALGPVPRRDGSVSGTQVPLSSGQGRGFLAVAALCRRSLLRHLLQPDIAELHLHGISDVNLQREDAHHPPFLRIVVGHVDHQPAVDLLDEVVSAGDDLVLVPLAAFDGVGQFARSRRTARRPSA